VRRRPAAAGGRLRFLEGLHAPADLHHQLEERPPPCAGGEVRSGIAPADKSSAVIERKVHAREEQVRRIPSPFTREYLEHIPRRIAELVTGREREVDSALAAGDAAGLEKIAGVVNALKIEGREVAADEAEIAVAPTIAELARGWGAAGEGFRAKSPGRDRVRPGGRPALLRRRATRFAKVADGPLYFLDVGGWRSASWRRAAGRCRSSPATFRSRSTTGSTMPSASGPRGCRRRNARAFPWGRGSSSATASPWSGWPGRRPGSRSRPQAGALRRPRPRDRRRKAHPRGPRRPEVLRVRSRLLLVIQQTFFGGWQMEGGSVVPIRESRSYPYGHGYSTMQLVHPARRSSSGRLLGQGGRRRSGLSRPGRRLHAADSSGE
jgi:hypothetical protein